eukprot:TRINITY_DN28272_c2_g2_i1.p1 TRINITY_DN28272_c2_g2~~TRINITY_DN28272_c2_g2_i1.p1  ORF type:complete len:543 (+),score=86.21 TRINITY_DN28272_c2_g2_i1:108-1631(+)
MDLMSSARGIGEVRSFRSPSPSSMRVTTLDADAGISTSLLPAQSGARHASCSPSCATIDAVAAALERDLEEERRERRIHVEFLANSHAQERDILTRRAESLERQLIEAREIWDRERTLLLERIAGFESAVASSGASAKQHCAEAAVAAEKVAAAVSERGKLDEARAGAERQLLLAEATRWASTSEELAAKVASLDAAAESAQRKALEATCRVRGAESRSHELAERLADGKNDYARLEQTHRNVLEQSAQEARVNEQLREEFFMHRAAHSEERTRLREEVHQFQEAGILLRHDCELVVQQLRLETDTRVAHIKQVCDSESREAMLRAVSQLRVADDCMQSLRQDGILLDEASRHEIACVEARVIDEKAAAERLAASLAASEATQEHIRREMAIEQRALARRVALLEEELQTSQLRRRQASSDGAAVSFEDNVSSFNSYDRSRMEALAIAQRHLSASPNPGSPLSPVVSMAEVGSILPPVVDAVGSSPQRVAAPLHPPRSWNPDSELTR